MKTGRVYILASLFAIAFATMAPDIQAHEDNRVSPLYFGPNALPVPDMLDGRVQPRLYTEIGADVHKGFYGDMTETLNARINIPLFTPRANLSIWMPVVEFYQNTDRSFEHFRPVEQSRKGYQIGNVYVSVDIHVIKEKRFIPDVSVRAAIITASGDGDEYSRYYDAPGYFFDGAIGKSFVLGREGFFRSLRLAVSGGFLCWQVTQATQNDAYMYGVSATLTTSLPDIQCAWQGYSGWIGNGDRPMVLKATIAFPLKHFRPLAGYEYGLRDYPFHHFRIGLGYIF